MSRSSYLFTSESVSEGHPDKVCDRISDEVVDAFFASAAEHGWDPRRVRVACETLATTNRVVIAGETRGPSAITRDYIAHIVRLAVKDIGYEQAGFGRARGSLHHPDRLCDRRRQAALALRRLLRHRPGG